MKKSFCVKSIFTLGILLLISSHANALDMVQNQVVDSNKEWKITFSDEIVFDSNIKNNIIVRDKDGVKADVKFILGENNKSIYVIPPKDGYVSSKEYELIVDKNIKSVLGKSMKKAQSCKFRIKDKVVPTDILIKETNLPPILTALDYAKNNQLWLRYSDGQEKLLVSSRKEKDLRYSICGIYNPEFSLDRKSIYFLSEAWVVSSAVHKVDIETGQEKFICDGNYFEVIKYGKYKGKILTLKHKYLRLRAYDLLCIVDDNGNEILTLGEEFDRDLFYKLQNEVEDIEFAKERLYYVTNLDRQTNYMRYMPDSSYVDGGENTDEIRKNYFVFSLDTLYGEGEEDTADFNLLVKKDTFEVYKYGPEQKMIKWEN